MDPVWICVIVVVSALSLNVLLDTLKKKRKLPYEFVCTRPGCDFEIECNNLYALDRIQVQHGASHASKGD